jgi:hypothetical protein
MAPSSRASGKRTCHTAKECTQRLTGTSLKVSGTKVMHMASELIRSKESMACQDSSIEASGKMARNMEKEKRYGLMVLLSKVCIRMTRKMVMVH